MHFLEQIETIFELVVRYGVVLFESIGVVILLFTAVRSIIDLIQRSAHVRVRLAEGIALALSFKLGGEVLRAVIVRDWGELAIVGAIIVLRAAVAFLLEWEIQNEKKKYLAEASGSGAGTPAAEPAVPDPGGAQAADGA